MKRELIVDLHVHSHYSRATSRNLTLAGLYRWGKIKGINVIGTGDFTHPEWFKELREQLVQEPGGLYRLNEKVAKVVDKNLPTSVKNELIRFVPTVEISTIYSKNGKVRKLHQLVIMPSLEKAGELKERLKRIGNLHSDGRPIIGLDSKALLKLVLEVSKEALYIPAHIWTPWFGLFGSKSGFNTLEEAYEELTPEIRAIETGLSSDPAMNWRLRQLDGLAITSNSDAHSPQKLGREATILKCDITNNDIIGAIKTNDERLSGTIEFFPEEGKYHYDGHREHNVRFSPEETKAHKGICPVCGKPLTMGVDYRVGELANHPEGYRPKQAKRVEYSIPLPEILSELTGKSVGTKTVEERYWGLIDNLGSEFAILRALPIKKIASVDSQVAAAIERMRAGKVRREPGYDGIYGAISILDEALTGKP